MHPLALFTHCPKCGSVRFVEHNFKSKECLDCGFVYYFNSSAATVALIRNPQGRLLVCRRAKNPAKGTLDLPGGFIDMDETGEEGVAREVREETGLQVTRTTYLFSLPNRYEYSGFLVHTLDLFFLCEVDDCSAACAADDAAALLWLLPEEIRIEEFGLESVRCGLARYLKLLQESRKHSEKHTGL